MVGVGEVGEVFAADLFAACCGKDVNSFELLCTIFAMKTHLSVP